MWLLKPKYGKSNLSMEIEAYNTPDFHSVLLGVTGVAAKGQGWYLMTSLKSYHILLATQSFLE